MPRFARFFTFFCFSFVALNGLTACESVSNGWKKTKSSVGFSSDEEDLGPRRRPVGNPGGSIGMPAAQPRDISANQVFGDPYPSAQPPMQGFIPPSAPYAGMSNFPSNSDPYNSRYPNFSQNAPSAAMNSAPVPSPSFGGGNMAATNAPMGNGNYQAQPNLAAPQSFGIPQNFGQYGAPPQQNAPIPTDINGMPSAAWTQESVKQGQQWVDQFSRPGALNPFIVKHKKSFHFEPLSGSVVIAEGEEDPFLTGIEDLPQIQAKETEISPLSHPLNALKKWYEYPPLGTVPPAVSRPNDLEIRSDFKNLRALNNNAKENRIRSFSDEEELLPPLE